jgi:hypothetical protein
MRSMESAGRKFSLQTALGESFSYVFGGFARFVKLSWKYFVASTLAGILVIALRSSRWLSWRKSRFT